MISEKSDIRPQNIGQREVLSGPKSDLIHKLGLCEIYNRIRLLLTLAEMFEHVLYAPGLHYEGWLIFQELVVCVFDFPKLT